MRFARSWVVSDLVYDPYKKERKENPGKIYEPPFVAKNILTNVTVHGTSIRFQFYYKKQKMIQRYCSIAHIESLPIFKREAERAAKHYEVIVDKIDRGDMTSEMLATLMPDSKFAKDYKGSGLSLDTTFIDVAARYMKQLEYRFKRAEVSASTLQATKKMVKAPALSLPQKGCTTRKFRRHAFNDLIIHKINTNDIKDFVDYLHHEILRENGQVGYSKSYVSNLLNYIKQVLKNAVNSNLINDNPAVQVKLDQKSRTGKVEDELLFSPKEREKILRTAIDINKPYLAEMFRFQVFMGLRPSEVLALAWEDISLDEKTLVVQRAHAAGKYGDTKTELSRRVIGITKPAYEALLKVKNQTFDLEPESIHVYRAEFGGVVQEHLRLVFMNSAEKTGQVSGDPRPWNESSLRKAWNRVKKESGINKPFSHSRHTFGSMLLTKGMDAMDVARLLGHTDDQMVKKRYGTITEKYDENLHRRVDAILGDVG